MSKVIFAVSMVVATGATISIAVAAAIDIVAAVATIEPVQGNDKLRNYCCAHSNAFHAHLCASAKPPVLPRIDVGPSSSDAANYTLQQLLLLVLSHQRQWLGDDDGNLHRVFRATNQLIYRQQEHCH